MFKAKITSNYRSLKDYPDRSAIWQSLPANARSGFIAATIIDLIDELVTGQFHFIDLEADLKKGFQAQEVQQKIIGSEAINLTKKMHLFDILPGLETYHAQQLIKKHRFTQADAEQLGQLVSKKEWKEVADDLYDQRFSRKDLVPALLKCSHLLGFWKRLNLSASGFKSDAINNDEWWSGFLEISIRLFPGGPEQNGLWVSAGGDLSQLYLTGTGREKWSLAIQILRNHGEPKTKKLVKKMREIYSSNETLKNLYETLLRNLYLFLLR